MTSSRKAALSCLKLPIFFKLLTFSILSAHSKIQVLLKAFSSANVLSTLLGFALLFNGFIANAEPTIRVGSKKFTENYILAEIFAQALEKEGYNVERKFGMDSAIAFQALQHGEIDVYPEYTGTIQMVHLKKQSSQIDLEQMNQDLKPLALRALTPLGFNNTYAIVVPAEMAKAENLENIGDLNNRGGGKKFKGALSYEFVKREDGWPGLQRMYQIDASIKSLEHSLAYEAVKSGQADFTDAYSTDAKIEKFELTTLKDNLNYFPKYHALPFIRRGLDEKVAKILNQFAGTIDETKMTKMNAQAEYGGKNFKEIADQFLNGGSSDSSQGLINYDKLWEQTKTHLFLTFSAIFLAVLFACPLGILLHRFSLVSQPILTIAGLLQTIPSIALLAFMIPFFGIGLKPAIAALFLFSILPILRNTYAAIDNIDPKLISAAEGIGLYPREIMWKVQIPLAMPIIIAGIRIAAVINIGTATLAAFIGAGGLGESIVTGLALNNNKIILQGAIPAALLAILVEIFFEFIERRLSKQ